MATNLREREAPKPRVYAYIKDPVYGGKTRKFVELLGFRSVNTALSTTASGTATIVFPDYKSTLFRFVSYDSVVKTEENFTGLETTNAYGDEFIQRLTTKDNAFRGIWNDMTLARAEKSLVSGSGKTPNDSPVMDDLNNSRSRGDVYDNIERDTILKGRDSTRETVRKKGLVYAVPFLNYFDPIFVDYLGQDGHTYAGFTGLVTRIGDNYSRTGGQDITIGCRDLSVLLDNVSLVSGWNQLSSAEAASNLRDFVYSTEANTIAAKNAAYSNIFNSFESVEQIITELVRRSQDMWRLEDNGQKKFSDAMGVQAFRFDTKAYEYHGISGRRGSIQRQFQEDPENMDPKKFLDYDDEDLEYYHYFCDASKKTSVRETGNWEGSKKILIDPLLKNMDNTFIHKLLYNQLALYRDSMKSADQIINEIVARMYAYKYFDANGNLIIEAAKPNTFPNLVDYGGRGTPTVIFYKSPSKELKTKGAIKTDTIWKTDRVLTGDTPSSVAKRNGISLQEFLDLNEGYTNTRVFGSKKKKGKTIYFVKAGVYVNVGKQTVSTQEQDGLSLIKALNVFPDYTETIDEKFKPKATDATTPNLLKWTTSLFHGKNYVLSPDDFVSFNLSLDEAALSTVVVTDSAYPLLEKINDAITKSTQALHGVAVSEYDTLAKLGVRRYQLQTLYNVTWPSKEAGSRVLSYQSAAVLDRLNAMADAGSLTLIQRPDLQLGRAFIIPIRMKSYMISGITNSWTAGGNHVTTLQLNYGRPLHKTLHVPWLAIFNQPDLFLGGLNKLADVVRIDESGTQKIVEGGGVPEYQDPNQAPQAAATGS